LDLLVASSMKDPEDHEFHSGAPDINVVEIGCVVGLLLYFLGNFSASIDPVALEGAEEPIEAACNVLFAAPQFDASLVVKIKDQHVLYPEKALDSASYSPSIMLKADIMRKGFFDGNAEQIQFLRSLVWFRS